MVIPRTVSVSALPGRPKTDATSADGASGSEEKEEDDEKKEATADDQAADKAAPLAEF